MFKVMALITSFLAQSIVCAEDAVVHIVQKGETVSDILFNRNIGPIYGKNGALNAILQLNPQLKRADGRIYPGDVVLIQHRNVKVEFVAKAAGGDCLEKVSLKEDIQFSIEDTNAETKRVVASVQEDNFEQSSYFSVVPSVYWQTLNAVHENIYRRSELNSYSTNNYSLSLLYGKHLQENVDVFSRASVNLSNFELGEGEQVVSKKYTTSSFYVGADLYKKYQIELGMEEKFYLVSSNYANADLKKIKVPKVSLAYSADFYRYKKATFSGAVNAKAYLPKSSAAIKAKSGYGAGAELKMQFSNQSVALGVENDFLKAQGNTTDSQSLFLKFTWDMQ